MRNKKKATTKKCQSAIRPRNAVRNETESLLPIVRVYQNDAEKAHGWKGPAIACGYCAMKAVYIHFKIENNVKLDPKANLWDRLGVDKLQVPALFNFPFRDKIYKYVDSVLSKDLKGALPMDMCEVLWEDGFDYETTADYEAFICSMIMNLENGYPAIALINKLSHWVVVSGITEDKICIVNSLDPSAEPDWMDIDDFQKKFNCAIMITDLGSYRKPGLKDYIANYMSGAKMAVLAAKKAWVF